MNTFDFDKLRALEDGWDSYDAPKPSENSIIQASTILKYLVDLHLGPERILASADGGVALIFKGVEIRRALIEILNGGEITTLLYDMDGFSNTITWKGCDENSVRDAVFSIKTWLIRV